MITARQVAALKYLIAASRHGTDAAKQLIWFLIENSAHLSKEVCVTLTEGKEGYSEDEIRALAMSLNQITRTSGTTHLNEILKVMGVEMSFSLHFGHFGADGEVDSSGIFPGVPPEKVSDPKLTNLNMPCRYTFWLAFSHFARSAECVPVTRKQIETFDLSRPGMYPELEPLQLAS